MTASFNLLLALLLLAPGFAFFAGVYMGGLRRPFRPAPAAPGSLLALALVTVGALVSHFFGALLFGVIDLGCQQGLPCMSVAFEPNPYLELVGLREPDQVLSDWSVVSALGSLSAVAVLGHFFGRIAAVIASGSQPFSGTMYGWASEIIDNASTPAHVINAFAVSDVEHDGTYLGYEGVLTDLRQDNAGRILSITLQECERFIVTVSSSGVSRQSLGRPPIPFFVIESENIKNIALNIYVDLSRLDVDELTALSFAQRQALRDALQAALAEE